MNIYLEAFSIFFKIGAFTIGGGYAMVPLIENEIVTKRSWIAKEDFIDPVSYTHLVDRSVTGKIARQQCQGELQLPLSDCGVVALDYRGEKGIATSLGHAPQAALARCV